MAQQRQFMWQILVAISDRINRSNIDTTEKIISQTFTITAWDSGSYYIPPIQFSENSKTSGILLTVSDVFIEEGAELKDIKQPMNAPIGWSDIWPWLLGIIIFALIIVILKKYVFDKKQGKIKKAHSEGRKKFGAGFI